MSSNQVILYMMLICVAFMIIIIFIKPLKVIFKFLINSALGMVALFISNMLFAPMGFAIGINGLSAFIVGVLGIPGFISLYILKIIL